MQVGMACGRSGWRAAEHAVESRGAERGGSRCRMQLKHLQEVRVRAFFVETQCNGREIQQSNKVAEGIQRLVVQERHAPDTMPQPQVAAITVEDVGVETEDGVRLIDGQQHRPRCFSRRYHVPAAHRSRRPSTAGRQRGLGAQNCHVMHERMTDVALLFWCPAAVRDGRRSHKCMRWHGHTSLPLHEVEFRHQPFFDFATFSLLNQRCSRG
jgi:hypothetical protein